MSVVRTYLAVLVTALLLPVWVHAQTAVQLTSSSGQDCDSFNPVSSDSGQTLAFESTCDLVGDNADGNREIFRLGIGGSVVQVTQTEGCSNSNAVLSANGVWTVFESDCDMGANPDGNVELFRAGLVDIVQLTNSAECSNLGPSVDAGAVRVAYDSDCGHGFPLTAVHVFLLEISDGLPDNTRQMTEDDTGLCDSVTPSIDADGTDVAFSSGCDLTGENEDLAVEIFSVDDQKQVTQLTAAGDDTCESILPSIDNAGAAVAFQSNCDLAGANQDGGEEIFQVALGSGAVLQLSDDPTALCDSGAPRMAGDGAVVTYTGGCDPVGDNSDGSFEVFSSGASLATVQRTSGLLCTSFAGRSDTAGAEIPFDSDCDPSGGNADGSVEIFRVSECICGSPVSRTRPPTTTDALAALRAAVQLQVCALCACDVDSSASILANDALKILRAAVLIPEDLNCPAF